MDGDTIWDIINANKFEFEQAQVVCKKLSDNKLRLVSAAGGKEWKIIDNEGDGDGGSEPSEEYDGELVVEINSIMSKAEKNIANSINNRARMRCLKDLVKIRAEIGPKSMDLIISLVVFMKGEYDVGVPVLRQFLEGDDLSYAALERILLDAMGDNEDELYAQVTSFVYSRDKDVDTVTKWLNALERLFVGRREFGIHLAYSKLPFFVKSAVLSSKPVPPVDIKDYRRFFREAKRAVRELSRQERVQPWTPRGRGRGRGRGGPTPGARTERTGDWTCPQCSYYVFGYRDSCPKCNYKRGGKKQDFHTEEEGFLTGEQGEK